MKLSAIKTEMSKRDIAGNEDEIPIRKETVLQEKQQHERSESRLRGVSSQPSAYRLRGENGMNSRKEPATLIVVKQLQHDPSIFLRHLDIFLRRSQLALDLLPIRRRWLGFDVAAQDREFGLEASKLFAQIVVRVFGL